MKFKYYLRGLGIGLFVACILVSVGVHGETKTAEVLSDSEIIAEAKSIGMVEESTMVERDLELEQLGRDNKKLENKLDTAVANLAKAIKLMEDAGMDTKDLALQIEDKAAETENEDKTGENTDKAKAEAEDKSSEKLKTEAEDKNIIGDNAKAEDKTKTGENAKAEDKTKTDENAKAENKNKTGENTQTAKTVNGKTAEKGIEKAKTDTANTDPKTDTTKTDTAKTNTTKTDAANTVDKNKPKDNEVVVTINGGDGSYAIAKKVQEAGLVKDAAEFDEFLCVNGYDKKLATGNHNIKKGATADEIAKQLISRN